MPGALEAAMRVAVCCDLRTVDEAVLNAELHVIQFKTDDEIPAYLKELREERAVWTGGPLIPAEIVAAELAEMEAALEGAPPESPTNSLFNPEI